MSNPTILFEFVGIPGWDISYLASCPLSFKSGLIRVEERNKNGPARC